MVMIKEKSLNNIPPFSNHLLVIHWAYKDNLGGYAVEQQWTRIPPTVVNQSIIPNTLEHVHQNALQGASMPIIQHGPTPTMVESRQVVPQ